MIRVSYNIVVGLLERAETITKRNELYKDNGRNNVRTKTNEEQLYVSLTLLE
jgi:hypothetical protein